MSINYYDWYKSHGICPNCGRETAANGRVKCLVCLSDDAERARRRRAEGLASDTNEAHRRLYEMRKQNNICVSCGQRPPLNDRVRCGICLSKARAAQEKIRRKRGQPPECLYRNTEGRCSTCGKPSLPGKRLCERCFENACRALDRGRQALMEKGYRWEW